MLNRAAALAAAISVSATLAHGQDVTGNDLNKYCSEPGIGSQSFCYGYILWAIDGLYSGSRLTLMAGEANSEIDVSPASALGICIPSGVTKGQIRDLVADYLVDHPAERHVPASHLVHSALVGAFPC